ncbi:Tryptase beta-2 [Seminavis robusta]|uniref:Tryptase beta-2 n=1 Tax=Seminavis robusta TaxID=568900 RepID=A0A9N8EMD0_9STRA|nr:Tryptase beta-2 [Seminavis robusta]|eukprot:Sro1171_g248840.1 Tryptase beta-2 (378) ;mRNA; r:12063-13307
MKLICIFLLCLWSFSAVTSAESSSHVDASHRSLIIGGHNAQPGRYPYFATFDHFGGGILIAPDIILTAGHCNPPLDQPVKVRINHDKFQSTDFAKEPEDEETFSIVKIVQHPDFYTISWDETVNDYNIFKISGFSKETPVKLNRDATLALDGQIVAVIGMGSMKPDPATFVETSATTLQEVDLTVLSHDQCEEAFDPARPDQAYKGRIFEDRMICTSGGPHNEKDACAFDSGSPLLLTSDNSNQSEDLVVGLVSWGEECADPFFPAVNARVSFAMKWIDETVCALSDADPSLLTEFGCAHETLSLTVVVAKLAPWNLFQQQSPGRMSFSAVPGMLLAIIVATVVHRRRNTGRRVTIEELPLQAADADGVRPSYDTLQ